MKNSHLDCFFIVFLEIGNLLPERVTLETNPKEEAIVSGKKGGYYKNRFKKLRLQNQQKWR